MPVSLQYPTLGKNNKNNFGKTRKNLGKSKKKHRKTKNNNISRLFGGGGSQPRLSHFFFGFFVFLVFLFFFWFPRFFIFFGFGHFQQFAPFCRLAVRCLHAFKLAGTSRLTTAAMNILGLRIKTACSNFEKFGHVLDNHLNFMLYCLKNVK